MMKELEQVIRSIVRDELRVILKGHGEPTAKAAGANIPKRTRGRVQNMVTNALSSGASLTTSQIADDTMDETAVDRGAHKCSIRNAVFLMHKLGTLVRDESKDEWTYRLARVTDRSGTPQRGTSEEYSGEPDPKGHAQTQSNQGS